MKIANRRWPLWVLYTLGFAVIASLSFGVFGLAHRTLIWNMDGVTQHYPLILELHRLLTKSGLGGVAGWSWTFGLGADKLTTLAYYVLGDPFAYLLALLPTHWLEAGYGWFIILRLYATGLAFLALARHYQFRPSSRLMGALTYAFTGYSLMIGVHHPFFLLPMIWTPLLFVGIDRILRGQGWGFLGVMTGLTILSNFYFAYILGLGSLIYAVIHFYYLKDAGTLAIKWPRAVGRFLMAAGVGLLISGVLLLPSLLAMLQSTRTMSVFANGLLTYPSGYYLQLSNIVLTTGNTVNYWAVLGISGLTFFGCVYVLVHWREHKWLALTLVAIVVGLLIPAVAAVFNIFSTPSNRWILMAAVPFGLAIMTIADHLTTLTRHDRWWLGGSAAGLLGLVYLGNGLVFSNPGRNLITYGLLLALTVVMMGISQQPARWTVGLVWTLVGLNLINNAWGYYDPNAGVQATQQLRQGDATQYIQDYFDGAQTVAQRSQNFTRVNATRNFNLLRTVGNNMTMTHDLHGVMSYFSVQNGYIGQFSQDLQNSEYSMNAPMGQADSRTTLNQLLGVKYLFAREDQVAKHNALPYSYHAQKKIYPEKPVYGLSNGSGTQVLTTNLNFPLVYTQPTTMVQSTWDGLSSLDRERSLSQAAVVRHGHQGTQTAKYRSPKRNLAYTVEAETAPVIDSTNKVIQYRLQQAHNAAKASLGEKQLTDFGRTLKLPELAPDQDGLISDKEVKQYGPMVNLGQNKTALKQVLLANQQILQKTTQANQNGLRQVTSDAQGKPITYTLTLKQPRRAQGTELYLALDGITADHLTTAGQLTAQNNTSTLGATPRSDLTKLNAWRDAINHPDLGDYWINVKTRNQTKLFSQFGTDNLSDYEPKHRVLMNLGYSNQRRQTIDISFNATKQINFKSAKLIAVPFGKSYDRQVHQVQRRGLQRAHVRNNEVSGQLRTDRSSILTTSIPYSAGWKLMIDGRRVKTEVVNDGFIGARISSGTHRIRLIYTTPGLKGGILLTLVGSLIVIGEMVWRRRRG
ncbi:YfhO family protein [Levilactobacillus senmaizukei]|nr:YfhO family protein [Levilactobacillus senmaizukei]